MQAYYGITEALVAENGDVAKTSTEAFLQAAERFGQSGLNAEQQQIWERWYPTLRAAASAMAKTTEVEKQRARLNDLSTSLAAALKELAGLDSPAYYQFCPMKKSYWLSSSQSIKNPYYGKKMLTCGKTIETIQ